MYLLPKMVDFPARHVSLLEGMPPWSFFHEFGEEKKHLQNMVVWKLSWNSFQINLPSIAVSGSHKKW